MAGTRDGEQPRTVAFVLPQFHPDPLNDDFWGPGFTEWHNVVRAVPAFAGHEQPHLPGELGFYDLRLAETRAAQAELARRFGIDAFCYYHYWFGGRRLLTEPVDRILASGEPDMPFMLCWANEDWRSRWDGSTGAYLARQEYSAEDDEAHIEYLLRVFADPRYVRHQGRPVLAVYRAAALPDPKATTDRWRARARAAGFTDLWLIRIESGFPGESGDPAAIGFDAAVDFQPNWERLPELDADLAPRMVVDYPALRELALATPDPDYPRYRCVTPRWDNSPRRPDDGFVVRGSTPEEYRRWLHEAVARADADGFVFVNAWNEWGEGAHLEPDRRYGLAYLDATATAARPSTLPGAADARARMLATRARLRALHAEIARRLTVGDVDAAAGYVRAAAEWIQHEHAGLFVDRRLEEATARLAEAVTATQPDWRPAEGTGPRRVLHVLTQVEEGDGRTELVRRWMTEDRESLHGVVLTGADSPVPDALAATSTDVHRLAAEGFGERVTELVRLMRGHDLVVLHVHPYDAVAATATARPRLRPPTVFVNHAPHAFWLGVTGADAVVDGQPSARAISLTRRGVDPARCLDLPLPPVPVHPQRVDRDVRGESAAAAADWLAALDRAATGPGEHPTATATTTGGDGWRSALAAVYAGVRHGAANPPGWVAEVTDTLDDALVLSHFTDETAPRLSDLLARAGLAEPADGRPAPSDLPPLSVVVRAGEGSEHLLYCLREAVTATAHIEGAEVVVVDHATSDDTAQVLATLAPHVRSVRVDDPTTPPRAVWQAGVDASAGARVLLVSYEVLLDRESVDEVLAGLDDGGAPVSLAGDADGAGPTCVGFTRAQLTGKVWPVPRPVLRVA